MSIEEKIAILISPWDDYSDLWFPFFQLFFRFWPDCPFKIYLPTYKTPIIEKVNVIPLEGSFISWSDLMIKVLKAMKEEYIFIFFPDLFLIDYVENIKILRIIRWMEENEVNYLRLNPSPKPDVYHNELVGVIQKGAIYRASTMFSIWKREVLIDLLRPEEDAWEFEIYGSERSNKYDGFYCTWESYFKYVNGVVKGKWDRKAVKKIRSLGIEVNLEYRKMMTLSEQITYEFKKSMSKMFKLVVPKKYQKRVRRIFKKDLYK